MRDEEWVVRKRAAEALQKLIEVAPKLANSHIRDVLIEAMEDTRNGYWYVRGSAANALRALIKAATQLVISRVCYALKKAMQDGYEVVFFEEPGPEGTAAGIVEEIRNKVLQALQASQEEKAMKRKSWSSKCTCFGHATECSSQDLNESVANSSGLSMCSVLR
mmetsp:Transcript_14574/g.27498  ORF Transcript_14574/g.27498 Transcript_14574/m.27498 type:complete len:163 (-) Transcript_14574:86-574(-)